MVSEIGYQKLDERRISGDAAGLVREFLLQNSTPSDPLFGRLQGFKNADRMTFKQWWEVLDDLQLRFPNQHIGVALGQITQPQHLGVLAYSVTSCPHLLEAMQRIARYQEMLHEGDLARLLMTPEKVVIQWERKFAPSRQLSDEVMLIGLWQFIRQILAEPQLSALEVNLIWSESSAKDALQQCFGAPVRFDAEFNSLSFPIEYLKRPIEYHLSNNNRVGEDTAAVLANPSSLTFDHALAGAHIRYVPMEHLIQSSDDFLRHFSNEVIRAIQNGQLEAGRIAAQLALSERTLHRRLVAQGTNFRKLTLMIRTGLAQQYLLEKRLSIFEVALLVGYSDQVAFTRAFKKYTGATPREFVKYMIP